MKPFWQTKQFQLRWNEPLGEKDCPYAYRWVFIFFGYSIRIHKWIRSDDKRYPHTHSWWFLTLVLRGAYTDVDSNGKRDILKRFSIRYRPATHCHYVEVPNGGCLSILITGKPLHKWGFLVNGRYYRPLRFFDRYGHPPCSEQ